MNVFCNFLSSSSSSSSTNGSTSERSIEKERERPTTPTRARFLAPRAVDDDADLFLSFSKAIYISVFIFVNNGEREM